MSPGVLLLFALSVACDPAAPTVPAGHTRFVGRIFDGGETFEGAVEIDESGVIVAVDREPRSGVEGEVEIGDGTLLPGLIDLHTHLTASGGTIQTVPVDDHEPNLKACLRNGVTSTLHLGGLARVGFEIRRRERDSEILSPRIFSAGPFLDPPGGSHCASGVQQLDHCVSLPSPEAATTAVRNLARIYAPDVIKITNDSGIPERPSNAFDGATLRALVAAAGPRPVVAHIRNVRDIESAVAADRATEATAQR
jgi:imidazolonepropionase-like amidohydrolase